MAWEVFERKTARRGKPAVTFNKLGRVTFNKSFTSLLLNAEAEWLELLWDKEALKVAFRVVPKMRSPKRGEASHISYAANYVSSGFSCIYFMNYIKYDWSETRSFQAEWNSTEMHYEIAIPSKYFSVPVSEERANRDGTLQRADRVRSLLG